MEVFWKTGLMQEDLDIAFTAFNLNKHYQAWGRFDLVIQKFQ